MNPVYLEIIILAIVGVLGSFGHAFKAVHDKNSSQEEQYTFSMYWRKHKFIMFFVWICVIVFAYYQHEWSAFEKLGDWRGLIMLGMGYSGNSAFPSLFGLIGIIIDKIKALAGQNKNNGTKEDVQ